MQACLQLSSEAIAKEEATVSMLRHDITDAREESITTKRNCQRLEGELSRQRQEFEVAKYRAVLDEARRWEVREARLVGRLDWK